MFISVEQLFRKADLGLCSGLCFHRLIKIAHKKSDKCNDILSCIDMSEYIIRLTRVNTT